MSASDFWALTPWQLGVACEAHYERMDAEHQRQAWHTWHTAVIPLMKKPPAFKDFVAPKKKVNQIDEHDIKYRLRMYAKQRKALDGDKNGSGSQR